MTDLLAKALRCWDGRAGPPRDPCNRHLGELGFQRCPACQMRDRLRERGVHLVTVETLAGAAQNHETSGIHGSLHCSLACGASLFAALEDEA